MEAYQVRLFDSLELGHDVDVSVEAILRQQRCHREPSGRRLAIARALVRVGSAGGLGRELRAASAMAISSAPSMSCERQR